MNYDNFEHIRFSLDDRGILTATMDRADRMNAVNERLHFELAELWRTAGRDPEVRVILITGAGGNFSSGGDLEMVRRMAHDPALTAHQLDETTDLVYGIVDCPKPVVSAVEGVAVGAGLVVALLSDISVVAEDARLNDGHLRLGVAAGDHAVLIWPLLCGMARAKRFLLTGDFVSGREAAEIGLVSTAVPSAQVSSAAYTFAERLASRDPLALRWTKRALNHWLRAAGPAFEHSLALEMLSFAQSGVHAALDEIAAAKSSRPA